MKKPLVLVVDDETDVSSSVAAFLRNKFDCTVEEFTGGGEALERVKNKKADIIILDIKMPRMSGIDVIKKVKKLSPSTEIIVVSAWMSDDVANEAISAGATDYITKPLDLSVLAIKVKSILDKKY